MTLLQAAQVLTAVFAVLLAAPFIACREGHQRGWLKGFHVGQDL